MLFSPLTNFILVDVYIFVYDPNQNFYQTNYFRSKNLNLILDLNFVNQTHIQTTIRGYCAQKVK